MMISLRSAHYTDLPAMRELFGQTIIAVCAKDYTSKQIRVWTAAAQAAERWKKILEEQWVMLAEDGRNLCGFITLANGNYVDLLYVHKDYQLKGVAYKLYTALESYAKQGGATSLMADASITARRFFERQGFQMLTPQILVRDQVELVNYKMVKLLTP